LALFLKLGPSGFSHHFSFIVHSLSPPRFGTKGFYPKEGNKYLSGPLWPLGAYRAKFLP
jgi:hypothetical protein